MSFCVDMRLNGISSDEQPTQEVNLEQQAPLPMAVEQSELKRHSLESKASEPKKREQGTLLLSGKQQGRRSYTSLLWWAPLLMFVLLLISVLSGRSAIEAWISHHVTHDQTPSPTVSVIHPQPTPTQTSFIDNTATLFMDAMLHKNWTSMWLMLSPDAQQLWQGEKEFNHFEQAKFGSLKLTAFSDSSAQMHYTWLDPDTTRIYSNVEVLHISLEASAPRGLLSAPSNVALSKGLFKNTLFALIYYQYNWRVLIAGPADPDAPILIPSSLPVTKLLVPIFMYHHVSNLPVRNYLDYGLRIGASGS